MLDGRKLKYIRLLKGFSKKQVADAIGISERWATMVENMELNCGYPSKFDEKTYKKWLDCLYGLIPVKPIVIGRPKKNKDTEVAVSPHQEK